jgi:hypothetical protein
MYELLKAMMTIENERRPDIDQVITALEGMASV